jgi:hypothetical protein
MELQIEKEKEILSKLNDITLLFSELPERFIHDGREWYFHEGKLEEIIKKRICEMTESHNMWSNN